MVQLFRHRSMPRYASEECLTEFGGAKICQHGKCVPTIPQISLQNQPNSTCPVVQKKQECNQESKRSSPSFHGNPTWMVFIYIFASVLIFNNVFSPSLHFIHSTTNRRVSYSCQVHSVLSLWCCVTISLTVSSPSPKAAHHQGCSIFQSQYKI